MTGLHERELRRCERELERAWEWADAYLKAGQEIARTAEDLLEELKVLRDRDGVRALLLREATEALRGCPLHNDAQHPMQTRYMAANLFQALSVVPDTGDWHAELRAWCERYLHESVRPNPLPHGFDAAAILRAQQERDRWVRLFNRLEKAVARHEEAKGWTDDADDALHHAWGQVLKEAATPEGGPDAQDEEGREEGR